MSQNTAAGAQPRTVQTADRGKLDVRALVLLAILLAAGFILNFTVGKAISGISGGMISPEFIISAFCLTILVVRPNIGQALVIGLISAAVIQITTTSPFVDFAAEGIAAMLMAVIVNTAAKDGQVKPAVAIVAFIRRSRTQVRFAPLSRQPGAPRKAVSVLHHQRPSQTTSFWGRP